jgi:hypothetical protein
MLADAPLSRKERRRMMSRLRKAFSWVGARIPRKIVIDGETLPLRRMVADFLREPEPDEEYRLLARRLLELVERKEKANERKIENDPDLNRGDAEALFEEAVGLLRAIVDLREMSDGSHRIPIGQRVNESRKDDARRWLAFVKKVKRRNF